MMEQRSEHVRSARAVALAVLGGATVALALLGAVAMGGWGKPVSAQYGDQPSPTPAPTSSPTPTPTPGPTGTPVVTAKITPTEGGTAESEDGLVAVTAPPGAVDEDVTITVTPVDVTSQEGVPSGNVIVGGRVYEIVAVDEDGDNVSQFDEPLQVSFQLTPEELEGLDPNDLFVYYFDADRGVWVPVPTIVDVDSGIVTAIVPHLTLFAVMRATFYEVPILPGANLLPFTGADGTPVELAFADAIDRISVVWRWDGFSQTWLRHIPGQPALSNFDTLFQYDIVYVVLQGDDEATLRMVAP